MLASTATASARAGPGKTAPVTVYSSSRRASSSALIAEISASTASTCSPRLRWPRTVSTSPAGTYPAAPARGFAGRSRHTGRVAPRRRTGSRPCRTGAPARPVTRPAPAPHRRSGRPGRGGGPTAAAVTSPGDRSCVHSSHKSVPLSATAINNPDRPDQRVEPGQPLRRQPAGRRRLAPVGPRPRQRDLPADTTRTDKHHGRAAPLDEQDLEPLTAQRMERVRDDNGTRKVTGRCGTMPPPSEFLVSGISRCFSPWGSLPAALRPAGTRQTSASPASGPGTPVRRPHGP